MATVNLGRIKPVWQGTWDNSTQYIADDIVYYNNSAWVAVATNTNSAPADANANWDKMAQGSDIPTQSGNSGNYLKTDGSALSWAELDVAQNIAYAGNSTHNSWSSSGQNQWNTVGGGLGVTITPSSNTSKILVMMQLDGSWNTHHYIYSVRIQRSTDGGSNWVSPTYTASDAGNGATVGNSRAEYDSNSMGHATALFLDSPATTLACQYRIQIYGGQGGTWRLNTSASGGYNSNMWSGGTSHLIALEMKQ